MTQSLPPAFLLEDVHYAYHDIGALHGLSLSIPAGQRVALLGANGSGKSTLLRLLDGLYFPDQGRISAFGEPLTEAVLRDEAVSHAFRRRVGLVFQNPDVQLFNPTVMDELAFGPLQLGWAPAQIHARIDEMLTRFAITHLRHRAPHRLSGGEKKRVALASVLMTEPEVLLLDEPNAGLDPASQDDMLHFLRESKGQGRTLVMATHELESVAEIADHCLVLHQGRLEAQGSPQAILADQDLLQRCRLSRR
ncbi:MULTISPECIES: energy-coupling factor ABC transporter ATP-binding protein [unclassified Paludibacterium]|uniref:energy-coupling factor ABC transporter ATP-binding protein n=1 Tax=unclassified Paludibacterium TaxID=2618429 RepID=UPI001C05DB4D|nr:ABC transporter ATP-binding protein [Paludibacterium sp. B53371]BEV71645.1 ABC transporter ATP-binding protein [Paludibacterium sp. THUN1379]